MIPVFQMFTFFQAAFILITSETMGDNHVDPMSQLMESYFPVIENYMPSKQDLKVKKLLRRLGEDFDNEWMSVNKIRRVFSKNNTENIDDFKEKTENAGTILGIDMNSDLDNSTRHALMVVLQQKMCETKLTWKKMEPLFWPKYIKHGHCIESKQCSLQPGMVCKMGQPKTLKMLHWSCKKRKSGNKKQYRDNKLTENMKSKLRSNLKCRWKKVNFKVQTKCTCSCR